MTFTHFIFTVLMAMPTLLSGRVPDDLPDTDHEFVQQLLARGFFELAEDHCRKRSDASPDIVERAEWELLLAECQQQHAWMMKAGERVDLLKLATERLTTFVATHKPAPDVDIRLRVRQIELLASVADMEAAAQGDNVPVLPRNVRSQETPQRQFALSALVEASKLAATLLKQMEQLRNELDRDLTREARDRLKLAMAEMTLTRSRLDTAADAIALRSNSSEQAAQLVKSLADDSLRFRARLLLAESSLDAADFKSLQLHLTSLRSAAAIEDERTAITAITIRGLLAGNQPSEVLEGQTSARRNRLTIAYTRDDAIWHSSSDQQLECLRLQALAQFHELMWQLDQNSEGVLVEREHAAREMLVAIPEVRAICRGVWLERSERIISRFERVRRSGPVLATQLEKIQVLTDAGKFAEARSELSMLISSADSHHPQLLGGYRLAAGELAVKCGDWTAAVTDLTESRESFLKTSARDRAAAADLLRIFALGQRWQSDSALPADAESYRASLEQHLQLFKDQPTTFTALDWLARLVREDDPLAATRQLLAAIETLPERASEAPNELSPRGGSRRSLSGGLLLSIAADCLIDAATHSANGSRDLVHDEQLVGMIAQFESLSDARKLPPADSLDAVIDTQQFVIAQLSNKRTSDWKSIHEQSAASISRLAQIAADANPAEPDPEITADYDPRAAMVRYRELAGRTMTLCKELLVVASAQQVMPPNAFRAELELLLAQSLRARRLSARRIAHFLPPANESARPGDAKVAEIVLRLLATTTDDESPSTNLASPTRSIAELIADAALIHRASELMHDFTDFDARVHLLLEQPLTELQLQQIAGLVSRRSNANRTVPAAPSQFWIAVQKQSKSGSSAWLESSLQLALAAESTGNVAEARRILGVVDVLHADWGTPDRKTRADQLRAKLEQRQ